jgi:lipoprotein-anchoring transpeptidase ErfK/SrfK
VAVVVDLEKDTMTIYDKAGNAVNTFPVTGGDAKHPSPVGTFTVTAKVKQEHRTSASTGFTDPSNFYSMDVTWIVKLDANGPQIYAMPWRTGDIGKANATSGDIGLADASAEWLYQYLAVGDRVRIQ